jgi:peroxiredoxin (alkyl hydroperoxide reductase subunit C)
MKMPSNIHVSDLAAGPDFFYATRDDQAPLFTTDAVIDGKISKVNLNDYLGKWVLLFFYPSDYICLTNRACGGRRCS